MKRKVRIGEGAGFANAWIEPARASLDLGNLDYLTLEVLAERSLALAQLRREANPQLGYDLALERRVNALLPTAIANGVRIVSNMGAANPPAAAEAVLNIAKQHGVNHLRVAYVLGDDVSAKVTGALDPIEMFGPDGRHLSFVSANAYIGAEPIAEALAREAHVVVAGRVADPALALGCLVHEFGWSMRDWSMLGRGTLVGHLLECSAQVTGGYYAEPGREFPSGLGHIGYPIAEVSESGSSIITKPDGTGGVVSEMTCRQQILYEVEDPGAYLTPDVIADFSDVQCRELATNSVEVWGADGRSRPQTLKVLTAWSGAFIADAEISYGGPGAIDKARLAMGILQERFDDIGYAPLELRYDLIGHDSLFGGGVSVEAPKVPRQEPSEVRLRVSARARGRDEAETLPREMEGMWIVGPAGGGGARGSVRESIALHPIFLPRAEIEPSVRVEVLEI